MGELVNICDRCPTQTWEPMRQCRDCELKVCDACVQPGTQEPDDVDVLGTVQCKACTVWANRPVSETEGRQS